MFLPTEVWRRIYEYDNTYHLQFKQVLLELQEEVFYRWLTRHEIYTNDLGLIIPYAWGFFGYVSDFSEDEEEED